MSVPTALEALEARQLLSATAKHPAPLRPAVRPVVQQAFRHFVPGKVFRPASDARPTVGQAVRPRHANRWVPTAYTNYEQVLPEGAATPSLSGSPTPVGLTADQVRHAYGVDTLKFNGITGDGAGQTIAIIDAYDHPGFVNSNDANYVNSDLHQFNVAMGLPDPPSFIKIDETGGTDYPAVNGGWAGETALDVEWAHAMAPMANIVLVEASSPNTYDLLSMAVNTARAIPGVSAITMSFGIDGGFAGQTGYDPVFTTPAGHTGVTFLASTGDSGAVKPSGGVTAQASFPADSVNVVGVGGTSLAQNAGGYVGESAWAGSGGGISNFAAKPAYQAAVTQSSTKHTSPDIAILGDPNTGVAVYDSVNNGGAGSGGGWNYYLLGGTSLSSPLWAGLVALANQGRNLNGLSNLDGLSQTLPRLYQLPTSVLHDITSGSNGYAAGPGYDLVSGLGTPVANTLVPALAGGTYTGRVFQDNNGDDAFNGTDTPIVNQVVYDDLNNNGAPDGTEPQAVSNNAGLYTISDLIGGLTLNLRTATPAGYVATGPTSLTGTTAYGTFTADFGFFKTTIVAPVGNNAFTLRLDAAGTNLQVFQNAPTGGTPTYQIAKSLLTDLTINGNAGDDTLTLDLTNGPAANTAVTFNAGAQTTADGVGVVSGAGGSTGTFTNGNAVTIGGYTVTDTGVETSSFAGGAGVDSLTFVGTGIPSFTGGGGADAINLVNTAYTPAADLGADGTRVNLSTSGTNTLSFATAQHLGGLTLTNGSTATLTGAGTILHTGALSIDAVSGSVLNLGTGTLIVDDPTAGGQSADSVGLLVASGYAAGLWNGAGIRSSAAAGDTLKHHAVGYGTAGSVLNLSGVATAVYRGETVGAGAVIATYTVYGDSNLNGKTDFNDFLVLQNNYGVTGTTFARGDYNYSGKTDFNDFLVLQNNYGLSA